MPSLILNCAPLDFGETPEIDAEILAPTSSKDEYWSLRNELVDSHVLRTVAGNLYAIPIKTDAPALGGVAVRINLNDDPQVACHLFREAMIRGLSQKGRRLIATKPVVVESIAPGDWIQVPDKYRKTEPHRRLWEGVDCRVHYSFDARVVEPREGLGERKRYVVLLLGVSVGQRIKHSFQQLLELGLTSLQSAFAFRLVPADDPRLSDRLSLVGQVASVSGGRTTFLSGSREPEFATQALYLEATRTNLQSLLRQSYTSGWQGVERELFNSVSLVSEGAKMLARVERALETIRKQSIELTPGLSCTVGELVSPEAWPGEANTTQKAHPPCYVFDHAGRKVEQSNSKGIRDHGPYSRLAPISKVPRVCLVCQSREQGVSEQFMFKFLHGIRDTVHEKGFLRTYGLDDCQPVPFVARDGSARAYKEAAERALREGQERAQADGDSGPPWDFAFVQVEDKSHQMFGDDNPYLVTKAFFLTHQIPVQQFRIETARTPAVSLAYSLSNMGLATYAKIGGVPWLLRGDPTTTHEIVLGSASAIFREDRLGKAERMVGITSIFNGDGTYYLHTISKAVPMREYSDALLDSLRSAVAKIRLDRNWCKGDRVRIIFHAFKPMKNAEVYALMRIADELAEFNLEFAFLHVAGDSNFHLFDLGEAGTKFGKDQVRGRMVPARGWMVSLSEHDMLVSTTGGKELKKPTDGAPSPVLLHLHHQSTFRDLRYLGQQVFDFASHSWRGFQPVFMPVTIGYSQLIASLLLKLSATSRWNVDSLCGSIGTTRWFL